MKSFSFAKTPRCIPPLDADYKPIAIANREYRKELEKSKKEKVIIAIERENGRCSVHTTFIFADDNKYREDNKIYIERFIKTLLWIKGGWKITMSAPVYIFDYIKSEYTVGGNREFDAVFMHRIYEHSFTVILCDEKGMPQENEVPKRMGGHLDGCRIGFDAGGSDRKVSAVIDGEVVYSEEVVWHPKLNADPKYQYDGILESMKTAAEKMPRVDAIGVSAAGIYINNRIMAASLFIKVPEDVFDKKVKNMFLDIQNVMGNVPIEVVNDGDVTALAGALSLSKNRILGIAMGTSEAAGYIDKNGCIMGWLNELAFVPVDYSMDAMEDEWSRDVGCGVKYFSQDGIIKVAPAAGIDLDDTLSPAEKLKVVQKLMVEGDTRARKAYETIGCYLGYALAYYCEFYDVEQVLLLGRVTSGEGGDIIIDNARKVLDIEFPEIAEKMALNTTDEHSRRVGQSVAAASLPDL